MVEKQKKCLEKKHQVKTILREMYKVFLKAGIT